MDGAVQNMEFQQQKRGASRGMAGFPLVAQCKMICCDDGLGNLHIRAVNYSLAL